MESKTFKLSMIASADLTNGLDAINKRGNILVMQLN